LQYLHAKSKQVCFPYDAETRDQPILISRPVLGDDVLHIAEIDDRVRQILFICDPLDTCLPSMRNEAVLRYSLVVAKISLALLREASIGSACLRRPLLALHQI
jgi:hypothetical protein